MTEVTKVVNPKLVALADALKPVRSAAAKLLTINEKASEQDKIAVDLGTRIAGVINGDITDGEQDVTVLARDRKRAMEKAAKIRDSAGVRARELVDARDALSTLVEELTAGIKLAEAGEQADLDDETDSDEKEPEGDELEASV